MKIGTIDPGEKITVNSETLNVSDYSEFSGELFSLGGGTNSVTYEDDESSRDVKIEITYKPRYI